MEAACRARPSKTPQAWRSPLSEIDHVCGPENEHESKRDQGINAADAEAGEEKLEGYAHMHRASYGGPAAAHCPRRCLLVEVAVLNEHDLPVRVLDHVLVVEPVPVRLAIVGALYARVILQTQV